MIAINAIPLPSPTRYRLTVHDAAGIRQLNALGQTVRDVMGQKRRVEIYYKQMNQAQMTALRALLPDGENLSLTCPALAGDETFPCYQSRFTCELGRRENGQNVWADVHIVLEEV